MIQYSQHKGTAPQAPALVIAYSITVELRLRNPGYRPAHGSWISDVSNSSNFIHSGRVQNLVFPSVQLIGVMHSIP